MDGLAIRTRGLVHIYHAEGHDVAALSGVDLDVAAGEMVGLLGPSGSGKSTLMSLLAGVFRPSAGKVFVGDAEVSAAPPRDLDRLRATEVGLMLQGAGRNLLPHTTPTTTSASPSTCPACRTGRSPTRREVLEEVGLGDHADRPLERLTPGALQLAAVAVAVSTRPGLLLCDEPTSQLDHAARDQVLAALAARQPHLRHHRRAGHPRPRRRRGCCRARSPSATAGSAARAAAARSTPSSRPTGSCPSPATPATGCHRARWCGCTRSATTSSSGRRSHERPAGDRTRRRYGEPVAVHPLDLLVPGGRMLSVTGPSGAGKSSLLWALARALRPPPATVTGTSGSTVA